MVISFNLGGIVSADVFPFMSSWEIEDSSRSYAALIQDWAHALKGHQQICSKCRCCVPVHGVIQLCGGDYKEWVG